MRSTSGIALYHLCNEVATKIGPEGTQIQGASQISVCGGSINISSVKAGCDVFAKYEFISLQVLLCSYDSVATVRLGVTKLF